MIRSIADDIAVIAGIEAVPSILEVACRVTGLRFFLAMTDPRLFEYFGLPETPPA